MKNPTNLSYFSFDLRPFFVGKLLAVCHTCAMGGMGGWGDGGIPIGCLFL